VSNGIHKLSHEFYWKVGIKNHSEKVGSRLLDETNSSWRFGVAKCNAIGLEYWNLLNKNAKLPG